MARASLAAAAMEWWPLNGEQKNRSGCYGGVKGKRGSRGKQSVLDGLEGRRARLRGPRMTRCRR
jgi:hypothetical protein